MEQTSQTSTTARVAGRDGEPLVSCIMPTRNRRYFMPKAIEYFLRQDYGNRELIVLNDGDDNIKSLIPDDPRIRYEHLNKQVSLGSKRNLACEAARGEIIIHWDDDDWMAPWRISYQVAELTGDSANLCGLASLIFYSPGLNKAWRYLYPKKHYQLVAGGSLCYSKALWRENPFADVNTGEDTRFTWSRLPKKVKILDDSNFYVAIIHDQNTNPLDTRRKRWSRYPVEEVTKLLGDDKAFYNNIYANREHVKNRTRTLKPDEVKNTVMKPNAGFNEITNTKHENIEPITAIGRKSNSEHADITVSIPYFGCADTLRRAVDSILNQSHKKLCLVVVNDGDESPWKLLQDIDDPRLVRFDLGENRGRYFADAVVLAATESEYYLVQDADDWSEKNRVEVLLDSIRRNGASAAVSACQLWKQQQNGKIVKHKLLEYDKLLQHPTSKFEFRSDHHGLFRSNALRALGGYYGGYRVGYDTLLMNLLSLTGKVAYVQTVLYNRVMRPGSLTTSSRTGMLSAYRHDVRLSLAQIYKQAYRIYTQFQAGTLRSTECVDRIGELITKRLHPDALRDIGLQARRLKVLMKEPRARVSKGFTWTRRFNCKTQSPHSREFVYRLIANSEVYWDDWAIAPQTAVLLWARIHKLKPRRILELGSGISTLLLAEYARNESANVTTLEHSTKYYKQTIEILSSFGVLDKVDLYASELVNVPCRGEKRQLWYQTRLGEKYDFIFIDGPPLRYGRSAALFQLFDHLAPNSVVWLHDANREHEQECLKMWHRYFDFHTESIDVDRGSVILSDITVKNAAINSSYVELA